MKDFRDLHVSERSHQLTLEIYAATLKFPREELYGPTRQIRRCAVSIAGNIAEGCGKMGNNEFQRYLQIASGSASELDYKLLLAKDLGYLLAADHARIADELSPVRKMLRSLLRKVNVDRNR
ncbi:MAG TPA: four helix bundle protein [Terriglobales bacterium]